MMKIQHVMISLILAAALVLSACSGQNDPPSPTEQTEPAAAAPTEIAPITAIDHTVVEPDESAVMTPADREAFRQLMDAMLSRADSVTLDTDVQQTDFLLELLHESPYYFFVSDLTAEGTTVRFAYRYSQAEQTEMQRFMDTELLAIANHLSEPDDNALDVILKVYAAVCGRLEYDTDRNEDKQLGSPLFDYPADEVYRALRDNKCLCYGFAYVLRYALLQRGIDAFCVYGECRARDMGHEWVMIRWDDAYFHCDPAWDRASEGKAKLMHFGKTDAEREADTIALRPFAEYHCAGYAVPECTDGRFGIFRGAVCFTCLGDHRYRLEDRNGGVTIFDTRDFSVSYDLS